MLRVSHLWYPAGIGQRRGGDGLAGRAVEERDERPREPAQVGVDVAGVREGHLRRGEVGHRVGDQALAVLPAPVDRRLVDPGPARDVVDGQGGVAGPSQFGERRGEDGGTDLWPATD